MAIPSRARRIVPLIMLIIAPAIALAACESRDSITDDRYLQLPDILNGEPVAWPFRPAEMRVHPLTRLAAADDGEPAHLEVRIEFLDADGHTTRCFGTLTVALHAAPGSGDQSVITSWGADLTDLAQNTRQFDDVTRTYLLRLRIDPDTLPPRPELRAVYHAADGRTLTAEHRWAER